MKFLFVLFFGLLLLSCTSNEPLNRNGLSILAKELKSHNINRINEICTNEGFLSILDWSDSLKNTAFLDSIAKDLTSSNVFYSIHEESHETIIDIGSNRVDIDAPHGFLILKNEKREYRINGFLGKL